MKTGSTVRRSSWSPVFGSATGRKSRLGGLWLALLLACGCADTSPSKVEGVYGERHFLIASEMRGSLAIGGVVLGEGVQIHRSAELPEEGLDLQEQAEIWSLVLYGNFLTTITKLDPLSYAKFAEEVGGKQMPDLLRRYAAGQYLSPEILTGFADSPFGLKYLLLVRIEADDVHLNADITGTGADYWGWPNSAAPRDHESEPRGRKISPEVEREVTVTGDLYDLTAGFSVSTIRITRSARKFIDIAEMEYSAGTAEQLFAEESFYKPTSGREAVNPEFEDVLRSCFKVLIRELLWEQDVFDD